MNMQPVKRFGSSIYLSIGLLVLVSAPAFLGGYELNVLTVTILYVMLTVSLNLVAGYCGQFSFSQGAFYGIGAYTTAILGQDFGTGFWLNLPAGIVVAGAFGLLLGVPALRMKGHFLAIVTIAFQSIVYLTLTQWTSFTGGSNGISVPQVGTVKVLGKAIFTIESVQSYFWLALLMTALAVFVSWHLLHSRLGREWIAIRDDETLASGIGLNATYIKLTAFVISAGIAGAAGVLSAHVMQGVTPDDFTIWVSCSVVAMMVVGGKGTFVGPIAGAVVLSVLPEFLGDFSQYKMLIYGVILVLAITFMPEGIVGRWRSVSARRRAPSQQSSEVLSKTSSEMSSKSADGAPVAREH